MPKKVENPLFQQGASGQAHDYEPGLHVPGFDVDFGVRLKRTVEQIGSQKAAGEIAGVKPEMIGKYIGGKAKPSFFAIRAVFEAQGVVHAVGGKCFRTGLREGIGLVGFNEPSGFAIVHETGRACRPSRNDRQTAGHGFQSDIAEGLGNRRVEENVSAGERLAEIGAGSETDEGSPR